MWEAGVLASDNLESFPWQKLLAVVPKVPVVTTPEVVVIRGRLAVEPTAPALVMLPWAWEVGVLASESLESLPWQKLYRVVPKEPALTYPKPFEISGLS